MSLREKVNNFNLNYILVLMLKNYSIIFKITEMGKFVISRRSDTEFQFNLNADNGEIILTSQGYNAKESCKKGIESVRNNAIDDKKYEIWTATDGRYYFNLKGENNEIIGTSEMYDSTTMRTKGMQSVKTMAPDAIEEDETVKANVNS